MSLTENYKIPTTVLSRTVGSETILLNLETSTYHSLNAVGGRLWALLQEGKNLQEAASIMREEFEVNPLRLETDLDALCAELHGLGLLQLAA